MSVDYSNNNRSGDSVGVRSDGKPKIVWLKDRYPNIAAMHREDETAYEPTPVQEAAAVFSDAGRLFADPVIPFEEKSEPVHVETPQTERSPFARPGTPEAATDMEIVFDEVPAVSYSLPEAAPASVPGDKFPAVSEPVIKPDTDPEISIPRSLRRVLLVIVLAVSTGMVTADVLFFRYLDKHFWNDIDYGPASMFSGIVTGYAKAYTRGMIVILWLSVLVFAVLMITRRIKYTAFYPALLTVLFVVLFFVTNDYHTQRKRITAQAIELSDRVIPSYISTGDNDLTSVVNDEFLDELNLEGMRESMTLWTLMAASLTLFICVLFYQMKRNKAFLWVGIAAGIGTMAGTWKMFEGISELPKYAKYVTVNIGVYAVAMVMAAYAFQRRNRVSLPAED